MDFENEIKRDDVAVLERKKVRPKKPVQNNEEDKKPNLDQDNAWREYISKNFRGFLEFAFPSIAQAIDWNHAITFEETKQASPNKSELPSRREADLFVLVKLLTGELVTLHIEQQSHWQKNFELRILLYNIRHRKRNNRRVLSFMVLTDLNKSWRPTSVLSPYPGDEGIFEIIFPCFKLVDYKKRRESLRQSTDLAAKVVLFALEILQHESKRTLTERADLRWHLIKSVCQKGQDETDVSEAISFLKLFCPLTDELEAQQYNALQQLEKENVMNLTQYAENVGLKKGLEQGIEKGIEKGERKTLIRQLSIKFKTIPSKILNKIETATEEEILVGLDNILLINDISQIFADKSKKKISP